MGETRRIVTIVFADVTRSTRLGEELDAEALRRVMERYFEEMRAILEYHGGTVEKFIGDAVMAVFGIPAAHEDDALRAVRAAAEMREHLARLNEDLAPQWGVTLAVRTGINTGEVVAGDPTGGHFYASGDAVNVAARLEQAAEPGEILLGGHTYRLVRNAVEVEALEPLTLKGKSGAVPAYRLLEVFEGAPGLARSVDTPFVGREEELARLVAHFERSVSERTPVLVTVLGPAGIGKTRLATELTMRIGQRATVLGGRCLSYGEGITFWPLEEIVRSLPARPAGVPDPLRATSIEETFFAYRKLFEALASEIPLALVLEDIHWADPTLLDFIEHLVEWTREVPLLVVCLARPQLLDERPGWSGENLLLDPLPETEVERLVGTLALHVDDATRARAAEIAEGNPLFLEQLLALAREDGRDLPVPQTLRALLAARLDCLASDERSLLEAAAVIGKEFWRSALVVLSPPDTDVSITLHRLVRRQLIRPERSSFPGEDAFQFNHILIRDATYDAIVKEVRAKLHEGFADWLQARESPLDEIVGYHLEQAYRLRADLGPPDEAARGLATRAAERLAAAGRRAYARGDTSGTVNLLERAAWLYPSEDPGRLEFVPELGDSLLNAGRLLDAEKLVLSAREDARRVQREDLALLAELRLASLRMQTDPGTPVEETLALARRAVDVFQAAGDDRGLALAWGTMGLAEHLRGHLSQARDIAERAVVAGERSGDPQTQAGARASITTILFYGLTPLDECVPTFERTIEWAQQNEILWLEAVGLRYLTRATVEQGRPRGASEFRRRLEAIREQIGMRVASASADGEWSIGELRLDPEGVEERLRTAYETLTSLGEKGFLSTVSANLAQALYWRGKYEEAEPLTVESEALGADEDVVTQVGWRAARAMVLARQCRRPEAEALAREAVERANATEYFTALAESYLALTEVLRLAERTGEASEVLEQTLSVHEAKGCILSADAVRAQFEDLETAARPI